MWRQHRSLFIFSIKLIDRQPLCSPTRSQGPVLDLKGVREVVEQDHRERFFFSPRIENKLSVAIFIVYVSPWALQTLRTEQMYLLHSEGSQKKLLALMIFGKIKNSAYSCFLATSFFRLSSMPGFAGCIQYIRVHVYHTMITCTVYPTMYSPIQPVTVQPI